MPIVTTNYMLFYIEEKSDFNIAHFIVVLQSHNIQEHELTQSQRALITSIEEGISSIRQAESQMDKGATLPHLGDDAVSLYIYSILVGS